VDRPEGWWQRFEAEVVTPLLEGRVARYQVRDWIADPLGDAVNEWRETRPAEVVIIEGNTSSRRALADRLALAVWVEAPRASRLERGVARDGEQMRGRWLDWMTMESEFFARDESKQRAGIRVDGAPSIAHDPEQEFVLLQDT
jgi:uridine kinase